MKADAMVGLGDFLTEGSSRPFRKLDPWHQCACRVCDRVSKCEKSKPDGIFLLSLFFFSDAEWAGRGDIVMSASDTQAAFMVPVSSRGSATARKAGVAFSATRVSSHPEHLYKMQRAGNYFQLTHCMVVLQSSKHHGCSL